VEFNIEIYIKAEGTIDIEKERGRLLKELEKAEREFVSFEKRMSDANFLSKAPASVVEATNIKFEDLKKKVERLKSLISEIENI
jgi:valyl-tRNA synthetase